MKGAVKAVLVMAVLAMPPLLSGCASRPQDPSQYLRDLIPSARAGAEHACRAWMAGAPAELVLVESAQAVPADSGDDGLPERRASNRIRRPMLCETRIGLVPLRIQGLGMTSDPEERPFVAEVEIRVQVETRAIPIDPAGLDPLSVPSDARVVWLLGSTPIASVSGGMSLGDLPLAWQERCRKAAERLAATAATTSVIRQTVPMWWHRADQHWRFSPTPNALELDTGTTWR